MLSLTDQDGRNEASVVLKEFEVLDGHPTSWVDYVNKIIGGSRIPDDEVVIVKNPEYFKKLSAIMKSTDARTVSNYLMWRAVRSKMKDLNHEASLLKDRFDEFEIGTISAPPRWKRCAKEAGFQNNKEDSLHVIASSMYVKEYFKSDAKAEMLEMIANIKSAFKKVIQEVRWMDPLTKLKALNKLHAMRNFIAYPDELPDEDTVTKHHSGLEIEEGDFFGNKLRINRWILQFKHSRLRERVVKTDWRENSAVPVVNAFYVPDTNAMKFPAGILQGIFFNHQGETH